MFPGIHTLLHSLERKSGRKWNFVLKWLISNRLCGLVVRVPGYRSGGPEFDSRALQKKVVGLERGPLSLVSTTEELAE
jgi:hypothetical protein